MSHEPEAHARTTDPATSHEAARSVKAFRPRWEAILDLFRQYGPMTDEQLADRYGDRLARSGDIPHQSPSGLRTRRSELVVTLGGLTEVGYSTTAAGRRCIVWGLAKELPAIGAPCGWCGMPVPQTGKTYCSGDCEGKFLQRHCRPALQDRREWPEEKLGETCIDGGKCHHKCAAKCFRRQFCGPLAGYSGPWHI